MSGTMSGGAVVVPTTEIAADIDALREQGGFRLDRIMPADDPSRADLSGHGVALRLRRTADVGPVTIEVDGDARQVLLPGGSTVHFLPADDAITIPASTPELVISHAANDDGWVTGRAGMRYRELLPGRLGGASSPPTSTFLVAGRSPTTCTTTASASS